MTRQFIISIRSFALGMRTFVVPFCRPYVAPRRERRSVCAYFDAVCGYVEKAERRFSDDHPEIAANAH